MPKRKSIPFTISSEYRCETGEVLSAGQAVVATLAQRPRAQVTPEELMTLGSGAVRFQWGLGIGPDPCNKLYVMHRAMAGDFAQAQLAIQTKTNPGQSSSAECGNRGYSETEVHYTGADLGVLVVARSDDGSVLVVRAYDCFGAKLISSSYSLTVPQQWDNCGISLRGDNCFVTGVITVESP
jgi:hypothetical protein